METHSSLSLGKLDLFSTTTGLRLQLSSELEISSKAGIDVTRNLGDLLRSKLAQGPFVQRGNGFMISLHVRFDVALTSTMEDDILTKLTHVIETATLWSDLQLQALSINISASSGSSSTYSISICLCHTDTNTCASRKARHKLSIHVPFHSVRPPLGVRTLSLDAVHLAIHITHKKRRVQQTVAKPCSAASALTIADCKELEYVTICDHSYQDVQSEISVDVLTPGLTLSLAKDRDVDKQSPLRELHGGRMSFSQDSPAPSLSGRWERERDAMVLSLGHQFRSVRTQIPEESQPVQALPFGSEDVVQIITSGFREAIADLPRRRLDNGTTCSKSTFERLSSVAPALFSPNYLSNVSGRAVFLPLLSHALLKVGLKNAKSRSLRSKMNQLLQVDPIIDPAMEHESPEQENIASKLFCLVQRGVFDPKASRRLPPFAVPANDNPLSDQGHMSTMLEPQDDAPSTQELEVLDDGEFDDEFDDLADYSEQFESLSSIDADSNNDGDSPMPFKEAAYLHSASSMQEDAGAFYDLGHETMDHETYPYSSALCTDIAAAGPHLEDDHFDDDLLSVSDGSLCDSEFQCLAAETPYDIWVVEDGDEMLLD